MMRSFIVRRRGWDAIVVVRNSEMGLLILVGRFVLHFASCESGECERDADVVVLRQIRAIGIPVCRSGKQLCPREIHKFIDRSLYICFLLSFATRYLVSSLAIVTRVIAQRS